MTSTVSTQRLVIGGLPVNVFSPVFATNTPPPTNITGIFLLHGRLQSSADYEQMAATWLAKMCASEEKLKALPIIITFDQRNHGHRLVDQSANWAWNESIGHNENHALDMCSIQTGTARDVSFLIDFLPSYLYPMSERTITTWVCSGVSLGGHATWIALKHDPRITIGIPIIGCPDYLSVISQRAARERIPLEPPFMPATFRALLSKVDVAYDGRHTSSDVAVNPFVRKKVLVLSGAKDTLVPWTSSERFVSELVVGEEGEKKVVVQPDAGHECTPLMTQEAADFILKWALL